MSDKMPAGHSAGSVLAQVLIMSLMMAILAVGLIRMLMNQYYIAIDAQKNAQTRVQATAAINLLQSTWSQKGGLYCSQNPPSVKCPGGGAGSLTDCKLCPSCTVDIPCVPGTPEVCSINTNCPGNGRETCTIGVSWDNAKSRCNLSLQPLIY